MVTRMVSLTGEDFKLKVCGGDIGDMVILDFKKCGFFNTGRRVKLG